jgi:acyl transferase domain-containing protein/acyl carrier protein
MADTKALTAEQQALLALRGLRRRVDELEQAQREPIAIVGMGCRIPGGVRDPESFWKLLLEKRNAVTEIPRERIDLEGIFDPEAAHIPGKTYSKWAGLLTDAGDFDAEFFGISPREALTADPQQRLLLETSWEALEDAGIDPKSLAGQDAGVFIGISMTEYAQHYQNCLGREGLAAHFLQGSALNAANGRLSYFYGLQGPSMAIDTACSSSLVAIDRACRSLKQGETGLAITGGVHLLATPQVLIMGSQWGMLSPRGACRAFDEEADGFVRAEGCGVLILKRLRDAEKDGNRILGLILGSAVNQDGASSGLTVPNGLAQQELVRRALANAGVEPRQVSYVEAHGTGTALGDPIEALALGAIFSDGKPRENPVSLGSVKTNIGHLESAAGVAGLIKVLLALRHRQIPAQLYGENPTHRVPWRDLPMEVATEIRPWEPVEGRRIAGISSFGFSGTNSHAIVEGVEDRRAIETRTRPAEVLAIAARTPAALRELALRYAVFLGQTDASWGEVCHSAATGRAVFAERLAIVAKDKEEAAAQIGVWLENGASSQIHRSTVRPGERLRAALIFGHELEGLDRLFGDAFAAAGERAKAWESRWRSWGIDPVLVSDSGSALKAQLERAEVTLAVVTGVAELDLPAVQLTPASDWRDLANAIAALFVRGVRIDWKSWEEDRRHRSVALPTYPFQRQRFWVEARHGKAEAQGEATGRPLLGRRLRAAGVRGQFETELSADGALGWIAEHVVEGRPVFPATAHLELMLEAGAEVMRTRGLVLEDLILQAPLAIDSPRAVQTVVEPEAAGRSRVRIYAENDTGEWETMSEAWIGSWIGASTGSPLENHLEAEQIDLAKIQARLRPTDVTQFYAGMAERGIQFEGAFRGLTGLWTGDHESLGEIHGTAGEAGFHLAPWRLDACLQVTAAVAEDAALYLPLSLEKLLQYGPLVGKCWSHARVRRIDSDTMAAEIGIYGADGNLLARLTNLRLRKRAREETRAGIYGIDWIPAELSQNPKVLQGPCLVLAEAGGEDAAFGEKIAQQIRRQGGNAWVVSFGKVTGDGEQEAAEILREAKASSGGLAGVIYVRQAPFLREEMLGELQQFQGYGRALALLQALVREQISLVSGVWLVTRNAQSAVHVSVDLSVEGRAIWALRRTAAVEFPELDAHAVDLDAAGDAEDLLRVVAGTREAEIAWRNGSAWKPRLAERMRESAETVERDNSEIRPSPKGVIDELLSVSVPRVEPRADEIEIEVHAHGVNFRDVMNALGMLPGFPPQLGGECAGIVVRAGERSGYRAGDRVFAFALGSFRTFVTIPSRNAAKIPLQMTFVQAAALPVAYLTAFLGLDRLARLRAGEKILIHSATGGLGLAAVHLAVARGAEIFATAGSEEKRSYLRALGVRHVFPSRTVDFAAGVIEETGGGGVDVVLNSLTGILAENTLSILAPSGRFLEVGKRNVLTEEYVHRVRPDVEYSKFDLGEEADRDSTLVPALLREMLEMLASGQISTLPVREFGDPGEAFRFMAQARHIGKIAVSRVVGHPRLPVEPEATYLITGGTGGVGLHFAEWLVNGGARHLLLISRGGGNEAARAAIDRLRQTGAEIRVERVDVTDEAALRVLLDSIPSAWPLRGVIHAAGSLDDHSLLRQSVASFVKVAKPKWIGAWNLHRTTLTQPLDFFVLFSSAAALIGMAGQANYSAANAMLDGLAVYRRSRGLPALSVAWGPWAGAGMAVDLKPASMGLAWITPKSGTDALAVSLAQTEPAVQVLAVASWNRFVKQRPSGARALFELLDAAAKEKPVSGRDASSLPGMPVESKAGFANRLQQAEADVRRAMLAEHLRQQTVQILSLAADSRIDEDAALHDLGVDSLMAVELRNALQNSLERRLSPTLALDYPTLHALRDHLLSEMFGAEEDGAVNALIDHIEDLSESEAEALLLAELERPVHGTER